MLVQRAEPTDVSRGSSTVGQSSITLPTVPPNDNTAIMKESLTILPESRLTPKEHPFTNIVQRQQESVTIDQRLAASPRQYNKSFAHPPSPGKSETTDLFRKVEYQPPLPQYQYKLGERDTSLHKNVQRPPLELLLTPFASPTPSSMITSADESLTHVLQRTAYYGTQPVPELALAPIERQTEEVQSPPTRQEPQIENISGETPAPDIDNIARDVYRILKRRLTRERERALGLS